MLARTVALAPNELVRPPASSGRHRRSPFQFRLAALALSQGALLSVAGCDNDDGDDSNTTINLTTNSLRHWNQIAIDASGLDHSPVPPGDDRVFGEQVGPGRSSKAMAIVHIAMFEAANAITPKFQSYTGIPSQTVKTNARAALAQAAHDALVHLFPSQESAFDIDLAFELAEVRNGLEKTAGIDLGRRAAASIIERRENDGSDHPEPLYGTDYIPSDAPGRWRQDPISQHPLALGAHWGGVTPFLLESSSQFRVPAPPDLTSPEYASAYDEAQRLGGDGSVTSTQRTTDQTFIGNFWAYDGTPSLCAPPRLYNQITMQIAGHLETKGVKLARLLALVNVAMADAGIAIWESKYFYDYWRPVTGIRESDPGTGPTGAGDGNDATVGDLNFTPLGAPASNSGGPNFTPPFPAYPSGHAGFGGALFQTLRSFYGTDDISFTFVSDEWNGITRDNEGNVRPRRPRSFDNLSQPEEENGQSRIYLGIHWRFDKTEGIALGRQVADWVFDHAFLPLAPGN